MNQDSHYTERKTDALDRDHLQPLNTLVTDVHLISSLFSSGDWKRYFYQLSIALCSLLPLLLIFFVVVYDWGELTRFYKIGVGTSFTFISLICMSHWGIDTFKGKLSLTYAFLFVGAFIVLFSQIYSAGAELYTVFACWVVVTIGWVVISRSPLLWFLWQMLVIQTVTFYIQSQKPDTWWLVHPYFFGFLVAYIGWVIARKRGIIPMFQWTEKVSCVIALLVGTGIVWTFIIRIAVFGDSLGRVEYVVVTALVLFWGLIYLVYGWRTVAIEMLAVMSGSILLISTNYVGYLFEDFYLTVCFCGLMTTFFLFLLYYRFKISTISTQSR